MRKINGTYVKMDYKMIGNWSLSGKIPLGEPSSLVTYSVESNQGNAKYAAQKFIDTVKKNGGTVYVSDSDIHMISELPD